MITNSLVKIKDAPPHIPEHEVPLLINSLARATRCFVPCDADEWLHTATPNWLFRTELRAVSSLIYYTSDNYGINSVQVS